MFHIIILNTFQYICHTETAILFSETSGIKDREIDRVKITKSLGIMIDENLPWNAQVDQITKKFNSGLSILRRLRDSRFQNINHNIFINSIYNLILTIARRFGAFWVNDYLIEQGRPSRS